MMQMTVFLPMVIIPIRYVNGNVHTSGVGSGDKANISLCVCMKSTFLTPKPALLCNTRFGWRVPMMEKNDKSVKTKTF